jgi:hypothetical protein
LQTKNVCITLINFLSKTNTFRTGFGGISWSSRNQEDIIHLVWRSPSSTGGAISSLSVFYTGNLLRGVPGVDDCDSPRSVTRRKRHVAHNLDRFGPRGA